MPATMTHPSRDANAAETEHGMAWAVRVQCFAVAVVADIDLHIASAGLCPAVNAAVVRMADEAPVEASAAAVVDAAVVE